MCNILPSIFVVIFGLFGVFFIYSSLFVYQDDQNRLQNKLDQIINYTKTIENSYNGRDQLMRILFDKYVNSLNSFFGYKISSYMLVKLILFVLASSFIFSGIILDFDKNSTTAIIVFLVGISILIFTLFIGSNRKNILCIFFALIIVVLLTWSLITQSLKMSLLYICFITPTLFLSLLCSVSFLYVLNKIRSFNFQTKRWYYIFFSYTILTFTVLVCFLISAIITYFLADELSNHVSNRVETYMLDVLYFIEAMVFFVAAFLHLLILNFSFLLLIILVLLNNLIWPITRFPLRFIYEHSIIKKRKVLCATGIICLSLAFPQIKSFGFISKIIEFIS